jgi:hypothetical protein
MKKCLLIVDLTECQVRKWSIARYGGGIVIAGQTRAPPVHLEENNAAGTGKPRARYLSLPITHYRMFQQCAMIRELGLHLSMDGDG